MKTNISIARIAPFVGLIAFPFVSFAVSNLCELVKLVVFYFNTAIYMIIGLATVLFVWNVYSYFFKADVSNKKEAGLYVVYSVIGFFVILSFWGLVNIVSNTFNLQNTAPTALSANGGVYSGGCSASASGSSLKYATGGGSFAASGGRTGAADGTDKGIVTQFWDALFGGWGKK